MGYKSLKACISDLEANGHLVRIKKEVDPDLEMAEIHRRVFEKGGPALLFENVKNSPFPAASNIYGTKERTRFLFRDTLSRVQKVTQLKNKPDQILKKPFYYASAPLTALSALPKRARWKIPVMKNQTTLDKLPKIKSWPMDGGAFITLPQVLSLPPGSQNAMQSNIGMYRIQLDGNQYESHNEIGLHYQLHRGIGVHHKQYLRSEEDFKLSIAVGGPPSFAFSAIMPLPEGLSEMTFAGMLNNRRYRYAIKNGYMIPAEADFVITGRIIKDTLKPEGPFGDHLGYYSLKHDFPYMEVDNIYHRNDAIWHFTVVGRPPAEDSNFGYLIHEIVKDLTKEEFPGIQSINAVDAAGVHPLLLAVGSERYMPFREERPEELLTIANHLLGKGQTSLAKYLWIANQYDDASLNAQDEEQFFQHMLERVDWTRDIHFQTQTTVDTLDYSGHDWNAGSKAVIAAASKKPKRTLAIELPTGMDPGDNWQQVKLIRPGIMCISGQAFSDYASARAEMQELTDHLRQIDMEGFPLIIISDDASFTADTWNNFLWVAFTRSDPARDVYGVDSFIKEKHWGCKGALVIDARIKPHHAPVLKTDPKVNSKVDELFRKGGELYGVV